MTRFRFRLAPVHDLRRHMEKESRDALARERRALTLLEQEGRRLADTAEFWRKKYLQGTLGGMSPDEMRRMIAYIDEVNRLIEANRAAIATQNETVEKARLELVGKMKDRKTLDLLYDRQKQGFLQEQNKKEQTALEEQILAKMYTVSA